MKKYGSFIGLVSLAFFYACVDPTSGVRQESHEFKSKYPDQVQILEDSNPQLSFAWSGHRSLRPLILVHGSPGSWEGWVQFLNNKNLKSRFHIIAVDRPGYGQSRPGIAELSLRKQASQIVALLDLNKSGLPAILVGHSFGGAVIARIAMNFPDRVRGLVFAASSVAPELERTKWFQTPATWWPISNWIPQKLRVCNEEIMALKPELEAMLPLWTSIDQKVVVIQGGKDDLVPMGNADFLATQLPPSALIAQLRDAQMNHFIPWQHPELILQAIDMVEKALDNDISIKKNRP